VPPPRPPRHPCPPTPTGDLWKFASSSFVQGCVIKGARKTRPQRGILAWVGLVNLSELLFLGLPFHVDYANFKSKLNTKTSEHDHSHSGSALNRISLTKDLALVLGAPLPSHILPQASQVDDYQGADESLRLALLMKKCCIILASFSMFLLHRTKVN